MCCETHDLRSFVLKYRGEDEHLAPEDNRRCRCTELGKWQGRACVMEADGEDLLCAWCRTADHMRWYEVQLRSGDPAVQAYYRQHGGPGYASAYPAGPIATVRLSRQNPEYTEEDWRRLAESGQATIGGIDWDAVSSLDDAVQRGLAVSPEGLAEAGTGAYGNGYTRSGPQNAQWTDSRWQTGVPGEPSPFQFTPGELSQMRAASRMKILPAGPLEFKVGASMTPEQVMKYLMNKYGGSIGP